MASSKAMEWGWFFLRVGVGLIFLGLGLKGVHGGSVNIRAVAQIALGVSSMVGLLVRPCAICLIVAMAWLTFSSKGVNLNLVYESLAPLLFALGLLVGGGGTILGLGAAINGFRGKWWQ